MPGEAAVEAVQAEHGDQQGAHAPLRGGEPLQVSDQRGRLSYVQSS